MGNFELIQKNLIMKVNVVFVRGQSEYLHILG